MQNRGAPQSEWHGGRIPPYSRTAEQAVLGAILLNNRALRVVKNVVTVDSFYVEANRRIFQAMDDLDMKGDPIDHVTLGEELSSAGDLQKVGGIMALDKLTDAVATVANVDYYAKIIREKEIVRKMIYAAQQIVADGFSDLSDVDTFMNESRASILAATAERTAGLSAIRIDADIDEVVEEVIEGREPEGLVKTGIGDLDDVTGGLYPGLMHVIAGRPGMGKSAMALNICLNTALSQKKSLYVSLEDVRKFLSLRTLARFADMDLQNLVLRRTKPDDRYALEGAAQKIKGLPFWVADFAGMTADRVKQVITAHMDLHGLDCVAIDHLQHVHGEGDRLEVVSKAAKLFADMAKELNLPVIAVSQLNRGVESRPDKRPRMSDLKETGEIEQVARAVWLMYRPSYYKPEHDEHELELNVGKANHGKTGRVKLWCDLSRMFITDEQTGGQVEEVRRNPQMRIDSEMTGGDAPEQRGDAEDDDEFGAW